MKDFDALIKRALHMVDSLRIERCSNIQWEINPDIIQRRHTWGYCRYVFDDSFKVKGCIINISEFLLEDSVPDNATLSVMVHEILHSCPDCNNHGRIWKKYAKMCDNAYSLHCSSYKTSFEELGIEPPEWRKEERDRILASISNYKWKVVCSNCGRKLGYYKRLTNAEKRAEEITYCCHTHGEVKETPEEELDTWRKRVS